MSKMNIILGHIPSLGPKEAIGGQSLPSSCMLMKGLITKGRYDKSGLGRGVLKWEISCVSFGSCTQSLHLVCDAGSKLFTEVEVSLYNIQQYTLGDTLDIIEL